MHKVSHSKFKCSSCQEAVAKVLTQMMEVKSDNILKDEPMENQGPINIYKSIEKVEEEIKDLNVSYSDTSSDGGGLSSPPPGMIKIQRRRQYVKGQGWTSKVIHPKPKVDEIKELIGEINDKQEKHAPPVSRKKNGKSLHPPR